MVSIAAMRAAGLSAEQIVRVLETAENEKLLHRREQNRIYKQNQRSRQQNRADSADSADMLTRHIDKNPSSSESQSKKRKKVSLPEFWLPNENGLALAKQEGWNDHKIKLEIHRFQDHAQQHNRQYADWQAAWRNWVTSPYQQKANGNGKQSLVDLGHELAEQARELERAESIGRSPDPFGID